MCYLRLFWFYFCFILVVVEVVSNLWVFIDICRFNLIVFYVVNFLFFVFGFFIDVEFQGFCIRIFRVFVEFRSMEELMFLEIEVNGYILCFYVFQRWQIFLIFRSVGFLDLYLFLLILVFLLLLFQKVYRVFDLIIYYFRLKNLFGGKEGEGCVSYYVFYYLELV